MNIHNPAAPAGLETCDADPSIAARAAATHGAVRIEGGLPGPAALVDFLSAIGPLMFTAGETPVPDHPDLNIVTNAGRKTPPRSVFHSDTSYDPTPPSFSALIAVDVPRQGGATLFTDQYAAWDSLPLDLRGMLIGAEVLHGSTDVPKAASVWHPLVRRNPITGRAALFLTALARCRRLRLGDGTERTDLLAELYAHSSSFQPPRAHYWAPGDVVIWDNRCTLHAADHLAVVGTRTLYRGMVRGEVPERA